MQAVQEDHQREVAQGQRFEFGKNWARFLSVLNDERIAQAENSLQEMLGVDSLAGKTFLDIGCGSGLFSLAAVRLAAEKVYSLDFDPHSVGCAQELRRRYAQKNSKWTIEKGSALDTQFLGTLGQFDVVYSWGVLHHTSAMWNALANVIPLVKPDGQLFISIYNDQGLPSRLWLRVKKIYNANFLGRFLMWAIFIPYFILGGLAADVFRFKDPFNRYRHYKGRRGMSIYYDWIDWLGGYPFEVAKPEEIFEFYKKRGFTLQRLTTCGGKGGCNEFIFLRDQ